MRVANSRGSIRRDIRERRVRSCGSRLGLGAAKKHEIAVMHITVLAHLLALRASHEMVFSVLTFVTIIYGLYIYRGTGIAIHPGHLESTKLYIHALADVNIRGRRRVRGWHARLLRWSTRRLAACRFFLVS